MSYNLDKLDELSGGDRDFNVSIIEVFLAETPADLENLSGAIDDQAYDLIYQHAHKIKPNAELLGVDKAFESVLDIEKHARGDQDLEAIKSLFEIVNTELQKAFSWFNDYVAG